VASATSGLAPDAAKALAAARRSWHEGDPATALPVYKKLAADATSPGSLVLEAGEVALAAGDNAAAKENGQRAAGGDAETAARARLLLARVALAAGDGAGALGELTGNPPAGLADLVALVRAQAAVKAGDNGQARAALGGAALRQSTNQVILEEAGLLADRMSAPELAGPLYLRAAGFPGWTADRSRNYQEAGRAFLKAGSTDQAILADRQLIEAFPTTAAAKAAAEDLTRLNALNDYDRGLLALATQQFSAAQEAFARVTSGPDVAAARQKSAEAAEAEAWQAARKAATVEAYQAFRKQFPSGKYGMEAWFQEGLLWYQAGQFDSARAVWDAGSAAASGDARARFLFWESKALTALGRAADARARLQAAADTRPADYSAFRARDVLAGAKGWPTSSVAAIGTAGEATAAEQWLVGWAGSDKGATPLADPSVQRGLALWHMGYVQEAEVEFNRTINASGDAWFLYRLGYLLSAEEFWFPVNRVGQRIVLLSPGKTVAETPLAIQRLFYPPASLGRVTTIAEQRGFDPRLFLALIYQESRDDPFALSLSGAKGIAQMMPATGQGIAKALGTPGFAPDDLNRPAVGIDFGGRFFGDQLKRFGGDPFRALAAYNAGPGAIAQWASPDPDLFVERISYPETRDYVRQIYVHDTYYRRLLAPTVQGNNSQ
ncbi:MAG TPA: lytic transglycosylase domain-containing protein, partial [Chloroflexota bacterium]|nr:lytic transglycosylase domain-containing protein [Chloroflexota bacterium]